MKIREQRMKAKRKYVDLKLLPLYLQYFISSAITTLVFYVVYLLKGIPSIPVWIEEYVIDKPDIAMLALVALLAVIFLVKWLFRCS